MKERHKPCGVEKNVFTITKSSYEKGNSSSIKKGVQTSRENSGPQKRPQDLKRDLKRPCFQRERKQSTSRPEKTTQDLKRDLKTSKRCDVHKKVKGVQSSRENSRPQKEQTSRERGRESGVPQDLKKRTQDLKRDLKTSKETSREIDLKTLKTRPHSTRLHLTVKTK